jgi:Protein of unknown function (DUF2785)
MVKHARIVSFVFLIVISLVPASWTASEPHDREFWRGIVKAKFTAPEGVSPDSLAPELSMMLASPDPELRDDLAYSILAVWIQHDRFSTNVLLSLTDEWRSNLKSGLGESETNSVLKRSFSALCLSEMARREAKSPFLGAGRYDSLVAEAIDYLQAERDLRGYDPTLHWIHATAHTADLLAALADSPLLTKQNAAQMLRAIDTRLTTAPQVYTQGEQDRLAAAAVSVIRRKDFDKANFDSWLADLEREDRDVWPATTPAALARYQNHTYLLQALTVRLLLLEKDAPRMVQYRERVLSSLAKRLE